jgi:hypothetical protein
MYQAVTAAYLSGARTLLSGLGAVMGIGTERGKGDRDQFRALESIYLKEARTVEGRARLQAFIDYLRTTPDKTTCDGLVAKLDAKKLGPDDVAAINRNWYGIGGQAQWQEASTLNPAQVQLVNRAATIYYLSELLRLAQNNPATRLEMWGQCQPPGFSIEVRVAEPPGGTPFITVDYYVPLNEGDYVSSSGTFKRYPLTQPPGTPYEATAGRVSYLEDPLFTGRRYVYIPAIATNPGFAGVSAVLETNASQLAAAEAQASAQLTPSGPLTTGVTPDIAAALASAVSALEAAKSALELIASAITSATSTGQASI